MSNSTFCIFSDKCLRGKEKNISVDIGPHQNLYCISSCVIDKDPDIERENLLGQVRVE